MMRLEFSSSLVSLLINLDYRRKINVQVFFYVMKRQNSPTLKREEQVQQTMWS